jgi:hypothetical protein
MQLSYSVCLRIPLLILNGWTNLSETSYVYRGTWACLCGMLHKFLPSVCFYVYPVVARQRLGKNSIIARERLFTNALLIAR